MKNLQFEQHTKIFCKAISERRIVLFPYQSAKDAVPTLRKIKPYLVIVTDNGAGKLQMVGYPVKVPPANDLGHYLFEKIDVSKIILTDETFAGLEVDPDIVFETSTVEVVCRVSRD